MSKRRWQGKKVEAICTIGERVKSVAAPHSREKRKRTVGGGCKTLAYYLEGFKSQK